MYSDILVNIFIFVIIYIMDTITDEYSRELGRRNIARYNERVKHMTNQFAPESLPTFQVKPEHILEINPPRNNEEYMRRINDSRAQTENNLRTVSFVNQQKDVEISQLKEQLKDPNVGVADAEAIYKQLEEIGISQIDTNDPQLTRKSHLIHNTLENEKRDRAQIIRNYGIGLRDIRDKMDISNAIQREAVERFGSVERAIDTLSSRLHDRAQRELSEGKGREAEPEEEEEGEDDIEVVQGGGGGGGELSRADKIFSDADAHVGHALLTKKDMVKWINFVKKQDSSLITLPAGYKMSELNKVLGNHPSPIKVDHLPAIIDHIRRQV